MNKTKREKDLEKRVAELEVQKHEKRYIHIPKLALLPLLGAIFFGVLSWLNLYLLDWEVIKFVFECTEEECKNISADALINLYPILGEYILLSLTLISIVAIFKGGYSELKSYDEAGLIGGLIGILIYGLIGGLIVGLIVGLIGGLIGILIYGLIGSLIGILIYGLIVGLKEEFE